MVFLGLSHLICQVLWFQESTEYLLVHPLQAANVKTIMHPRRILLALFLIANYYVQFSSPNYKKKNKIKGHIPFPALLPSRLCDREGSNLANNM